MPKNFDDEIQAKKFIKSYFKNYTNFSEEILIFYYRLIKDIVSKFEFSGFPLSIDILKFKKNFENLNFDYKTILELRYGKKNNMRRSYREISELLNYPTSKIYKIVKKSLNILKKDIKVYFIDSITYTSTTSIRELNLKNRITNALLRGDITSIEELKNTPKASLLTIKGIGEKTYSEILEKLKTYKSNSI